MSNLIIKTNELFGEVRFCTIEGKNYAVGKDVAMALGYVNPTKAVSTHCKGVSKMGIPSNGGIQEMSIIPEGDIYRLITKSKLPQAEKFESWVFDEVLPTIRKTGGYVNNDDLFVNTYLPFADDTTKALFKGTLETVRKQNELIQSQKKQLEEQAPMVEFTNTVLKSSDNILVRELAKIASDEGFKIGEKKLYAKLREWKMIFLGSTEPYQKYIDNGIFVVEEKPYTTPYGKKLSKVTKVSPLGQVKIIEKLRKEFNK